MEDVENVQVKIMSTEMMKPSIPTPTSEKWFKVSSVDQISPQKHFPIIVCYTNSRDQALDITALKQSLRETLTQFYPLAGRCVDDSTLDCNDQGVPLIESQVNSELSDVLSSSNRLDMLSKLLPARQLYMSYGQLPKSDIVHMAIQVNVFRCGGVVIASYFLHKLLDATSAALFLNYWASLAKPKSTTSNLCQIQPDFNAAVNFFPPRPLPDHGDGGSGGGGAASMASRLSQVKSIKVVGKSFVFNNANIKKIKAMAATSPNLQNPTSFEAVMGFIWHHIFTAACTVTAIPSHNSSGTSILFKANIRSKSQPPLPKASIGNLTKSVHVSVNESSEFPDLATRIHEAISKMKENLVGSLPETNSFANRGYKFGSYSILSWCKIGFSEVDFGFGKPGRIIPAGMVHPFLRNMVMLVDHMDHSQVDGIEAWLFLEEKEMQILESNSQFFALVTTS